RIPYRRGELLPTTGVKVAVRSTEQSQDRRSGSGIVAEGPALVARAILKIREVEALLQKAARSFETARDPAALDAAEELAARAAETAAEAHHAASLFAGLVKTETAVRRRRTLW